MSFTVGSVPYVNAKPLVHRFETGEVPVAIKTCVPSELPAMLDSKEADAVLVSSYEALATLGRTMGDGVGICSQGAVQSVRLFSKVPFRAIQTLALDQSSLTSNHLARCLLAERYYVHPHSRPEAPNLIDMLTQYDACILIGDIGMTAPSEGLHVMDLGAEWVLHTSLPFVWALWVGREDLSQDLVKLLIEEKDWGVQNIETVARTAAIKAGWPTDMAIQYLTETICFDLGKREKQGLETYREVLLRNGFIHHHGMPKWVSPQVAKV